MQAFLLCRVLSLLRNKLVLYKPTNQSKKKPARLRWLFKFGSPTWTRTRDLRINSPSLYRLSYQGFDAGAILTTEGHSVNIGAEIFID